MPEEPRVWVLDTSALVDFKALISVADQWTTFKLLEDLVADPTKTTEEADPYVLALALHLRDQERDPCVVTSDQVDRMPLKIALTTACDRLSINYMSPREFLEGIGVQTKKI